MKKTIKSCPDFPFFGATYPDAGCIAGSLHDLDNCDDNGTIYLKEEDFPCPFCRGEEYVIWASSYYSISRKKARETKNWLRLKYGNPKYPVTNTKFR